MMRNDKRALLVALLTVVAALALVGPATASAAVWKDGATTVTGNITLGLTGAENFEFTTGTVGGMNCGVHMTMKKEASLTKVTGWEQTTCSPFGGMAGCSVSTTEAIGLPWAATLNTGNITVSGMHIKRKFKAGCSRTEWNATMTSTKFTPPIASAITEFETSGEISGSKTYGSVKVDSPNSGTYGIG
jgi:hypothetical protein